MRFDSKGVAVSSSIAELSRLSSLDSNEDVVTPFPRGIFKLLPLLINLSASLPLDVTLQSEGNNPLSTEDLEIVALDFALVLFFEDLLKITARSSSPSASSSISFGLRWLYISLPSSLSSVFIVKLLLLAANLLKCEGALSQLLKAIESFLELDIEEAGEFNKGE